MTFLRGCGCASIRSPTAGRCLGMSPSWKLQSICSSGHRMRRRLRSLPSKRHRFGAGRSGSSMHARPTSPRSIETRWKATKTLSPPTRAIRWRAAFERSSRPGVRRSFGAALETTTRRRPIGHISNVIRAAPMPTIAGGVWPIFRRRWSRRPLSSSLIMACLRHRPMKSSTSSGRSSCSTIRSSALNHHRRRRRSFSFRRRRFISLTCHRRRRRLSLSCCRSLNIGPSRYG